MPQTDYLPVHVLVVLTTLCASAGISSYWARVQRSDAPGYASLTEHVKFKRSPTSNVLLGLTTSSGTGAGTASGDVD